MQSYIYFIIFLCYDFYRPLEIWKSTLSSTVTNDYATASVSSLVAGRRLFENVLMDIKPQHDNNLSLASLLHQNSYQITRLTETETTVIQNKNVEEINGYLEYLNDKIQSDLLSSIQYYEIYLQKPTSDLSSICDHYSYNLKRYFNRTFDKEDAINDIDKQFVLFDLMETSNKILLKTKRKIINNMTDNQNVNFSTDAVLLNKYYKLLDDLDKENVNNKKEEIKHICETFNICRVFPAYSDYISDLLYEILYLSNIRLDNIVTQVTELIKENINFFRDFLGDELTTAVGDKMNSFFSVDATELRHVLSMFKQLLRQRHKFSIRKNHNRSIKAKAIRILIDIVDRAFEKDDDEILLLYISITKNGLRDWTAMEEHDIRAILENFIRYVTVNLKYNWNADTKKEVRTLVEVLMKTKVRSQDVYEYLFSKGSQYVKNQKNDDIYLDLI